MLTSREVDQLETAIRCMHCVSLNDKDYILRHNVLVLINKFAEPYQEEEQAPSTEQESEE